MRRPLLCISATFVCMRGKVFARHDGCGARCAEYQLCTKNGIAAGYTVLRAVRIAGKSASAQVRTRSGRSESPVELLHGALVSLDHFLDHLTADAASLAGGQVAIVAVLQVDADFPRRSFSS